MFSLVEQLLNVPTPLADRTITRCISKPRSKMTPEELLAWKEKRRAKDRAYRARNIEACRKNSREARRRARAQSKVM